MPQKLIMTSGGFDPLHPGHIEYLKKAKELDLNVRHVVALNSDAWLMRKKGYLMMSFEERCEILLALRCVDMVYQVDDSDDSVCQAIAALKPDIFAKGGDRDATNTPEAHLCSTLGVKMVYGLGDKISSSSTIFRGSLPKVQRAWGDYKVIYNDKGVQIKILNVQPGKVTSMQRHARRNEIFINLDKIEERDHPDYVITNLICGAVAGDWHQLRGGEAGQRILEIQYGPEIREDDIERKS